MKPRRSGVSLASRTFRLEVGLLKSLCESIGSTRAQTVYMLASAGEWNQLLSLGINPDHYDDPLSFSDDYLVTSVMQKNPRLPTDIDKQHVAIEKFYASETLCAETNLRLSPYFDGKIPLPDGVSRAIHFARETIREILGPLTRADLHYAERNMRFGPGATTSLSGVVTQGTKYSRPSLDATPRVADFRTYCFPNGWRCVDNITLRHSSKLTTVPKNAKTDRVICIEPDLNIFVQLGCGALIREKLRVFGLDLRSQKRNQDLAMLASELDLCTMDLSSASDTISREVVWGLLPDRWAQLLHFSRVDKTRVNGEEIELQKWSSMGNGYTFELESLLFLSVVIGCCKASGFMTDNVAVYGDDLIFPNEVRECVESTLTFLGFKVNHEKTFGKGRFHESCGTDWFDGVNVRPFYFRSEFHDFESICYLYANNARRWSSRRNGGYTCDSRLLPVWVRCFRAVDPPHRHLIPEGFGDVGFAVDFDAAKPAIRLPTEPGWCGYYFRYRRVTPDRKTISTSGCLTAFLNGNQSDFSFGRESLRGRFLPATTGRLYSLEWPNLGPWQ